MANPRRGIPVSKYISKCVTRFPELTYDGTVIHCRICKTDLVGWNSYNCRRHVESARHKRNRKLQVPHWVFLYDFIFMLSVCGIPQYVLDKEHFRAFWKKYVPEWPLPTRRQVRRQFTHVKSFLENNIRSELSGKPLWLTVHESTDAKKNKVGNVLVRVLHSDKPSKPYLIASKRLESSNTVMIEQLVLGALHKFNIHKNNVLILVTDGATHMVKAGASLKKHCCNLLHITCLLRACYLVVDIVKNSYPDVDKLISSTKMVFVKSAKRTQEFRKACLKVPETPQPILTKWGTWLEAAFYYNKHYDIIKSVISSFDPKEAPSIRDSQQQFGSEKVRTDLLTICQNYEVLLNTIDQLQSSSLSLGESFDTVDYLNACLHTLIDFPGICAGEKFMDTLSKNPDYVELRCISECLRDNRATNLKEKFTYASITSLDVERSFSKYNSTFSSTRTCLSADTVEGLLLMQMYAEIHTPPLMGDKK